MTAREHPDSKYRYAPGIEPYSGGVIATEGHRIRHVEVTGWPRWQDGFSLIEEYLSARGLDRRSLCAVELRCPQPHTFDGFISFNGDYRAQLAGWDLLVGDDNPVARTNVAPVHHPPLETVLAGFSVVVPEPLDRPTFVVAGAGDLVDQADLRPEAIVDGQGSDGGPWGARVDQVLDEMESRLAALGVGWDLVTDIDVYCATAGWSDALDRLMARCGSAAARGLHWFISRPPITGLSFEMDLRGVVDRDRL